MSNLFSGHFSDLKDDLQKLYLEDPRPWLVGFSGGKDSTMVASLVFEAVMGLAPEQRVKPIAVLCTDTRVEIPAIVEHVETTLAKMHRCSQEHDLHIEVHLLRPPIERSFWVNVIGRGYPPPSRFFRWCTSRLKIDPMSGFVERWIGRWGEVIFHLGARRSESATRAQSLSSRAVSKNGLSRHPDLPRAWISNPIEFLTTEEVWAYLLQKPPLWGGSNRALYRLYADAAGGECPVQLDNSSPSCGSSRFGCWTCTVVDKDKASEGLLASGDDRMEQLISFRDILMHYRDPANGKRDTHRMNGQPTENNTGPLLLESRRELLHKLLALQEETGLELISQPELLAIQRHWNAARGADDGRGVARIWSQVKGISMSQPLDDADKLSALTNEVCREKGISPDNLRRMLAKVEEYSEYHRANGLPEDLLRILQDELKEQEEREGKVEEAVTA